jgi:hypothetical protein
MLVAKSFAIKAESTLKLRYDKFGSSATSK